jgi:cytochrome b involved in lipid metabolism
MYTNHKTLLGSVALIVVFLCGTFFVLNGTSRDAVVEGDSSETEIVATPHASEFTGDTSIRTESESEQDTSVTNIDAAPTTPKKVGYTLNEVSLHSSASSCWSIIDGNVYDLTSFIGKHPGGERNILKLCGKDGTDMFMGKHGGDSKPETALANFLLGTYSG